MEGEGWGEIGKLSQCGNLCCLDVDRVTVYLKNSLTVERQREGVELSKQGTFAVCCHRDSPVMDAAVGALAEGRRLLQPTP